MFVYVPYLCTGLVGFVFRTVFYIVIDIKASHVCTLICTTHERFASLKYDRSCLNRV